MHIADDSQRVANREEHSSTFGVSLVQCPVDCAARFACPALTKSNRQRCSSSFRSKSSSFSYEDKLEALDNESRTLPEALEKLSAISYGSISGDHWLPVAHEPQVTFNELAAAAVFGGVIAPVHRGRDPILLGLARRRRHSSRAIGPAVLVEIPIAALAIGLALCYRSGLT